MPYQGIGPYPAGDTGLEAMIDSALWAGQEGRTSATPQEQAAAYADLQATDFSGGFATPPARSTSIMQWLEQNSTAVYLGVGALVLMSVFKGGGRR